MIGKDRDGLPIVLVQSGYGFSRTSLCGAWNIRKQLDRKRTIPAALSCSRLKITAGHVYWMCPFQPLLISREKEFLVDPQSRVAADEDQRKVIRLIIALAYSF
jgi:hypothetical protein